VSAGRGAQRRLRRPRPRDRKARWRGGHGCARL